LLAFFLVAPSLLLAQRKNLDFRYNIKKATAPIHVDGVIEEAWLDTETASDFNMVLPMDTSKALVKTEVKMSYDNTHLYIVAICYFKENQPYMVESLKRDFSFGKNDNFLLFMDPFDDQINGFTFGSNAAGAQWDGLLFDGGKADLNWDNKWTSHVKTYKDKWIWEASIPFKTIRYKNGITTWGINFFASTALVPCNLTIIGILILPKFL